MWSVLHFSISNKVSTVCHTAYPGYCFDTCFPKLAPYCAYCFIRVRFWHLLPPLPPHPHPHHLVLCHAVNGILYISAMGIENRNIVQVSNIEVFHYDIQGIVAAFFSFYYYSYPAPGSYVFSESVIVCWCHIEIACSTSVAHQ